MHLLPYHDHCGTRRALRSFGFLLLGAGLLPAAAGAQEPPPVQPEDHAHHHSAPAAAPAKRDPASGVLKIRYRCPGETVAGQEPGTCVMVIQKNEFDALVRALDPDMPADSRLSLAADYSRLLIMAAEARRRHVDDQPEIAALLQFSTLQVLASRLVQEISARPSAVSDGDIERYFREHQRDYQEVSLIRVLVSSKPMDNGHNAVPPRERALALRARAAGGEDFAVLGLAAGSGSPEAAGSNGKLGPMPCQSLPEGHRQVCDLRPGEISAVLPDSLGFVFYRLESLRARTLEDVHGLIRSKLERQRTQEEIESIRTPLGLDLDEGYFGKLPTAHVANEHGMHFPATVTAPPPGPAGPQ